MHDSTLESMASAIEQAQCILMVVTEKYRLSVNCQAEAKYAFRLQKTIIPIILQSGYHNIDGWLGFIISDKIFIDFTKYSFEEAMNKLINQLKLNNDSLPIPSIAVTAANNPKEIIQNEAKNWNEEQCKEWFIKNNIKNMFDILTPIDGGILLQLYEMKKSIPEFFFKSITKNDAIDFKSVAVFANLLIKLFEK